MEPSRRQHFSLDRTADPPTLLYEGRPLHDGLIEEVLEVTSAHRIPTCTDRHCLEAAILVVASQATPYERAVGFVRRLADWPEEYLHDADRIYDEFRREGTRRYRWPENRFAPVLAHLDGYPGGPAALARRYLGEPRTMRRLLAAEVGYLGYKSASFLGLCWGVDRDIMTLDVHVLRQAAGLGVAMDSSHYLGKRRTRGRTEGRNIFTQPRPEEYEAIEQDILDLLGETDLPRRSRGFHHDDAAPDTAAITTLFWWAGARGKRMAPAQEMLFPGFVTPYSLA